MEQVYSYSSVEYHHSVYLVVNPVANIHFIKKQNISELSNTVWLSNFVIHDYITCTTDAVFELD
jgi:hypothetical protein